MSDTARDYQPLSAATTDGMEELFEPKDTPVQPSLLAQHSPGLDNLQAKDSPALDIGGKPWTVVEAAKRLGVSEKTILRRLQKGTLPGHKVIGQFGREWRINPIEVKNQTHEVAQLRTPLDICPAQDTPAQAVEMGEPRTPQDSSAESESSILTIALEQPANVVTQILEEQKQEIASLREQLECAIYRNGYLESKLEDREKQILLLTDSQHKGGWWAKFSSWFFKGK
jgi:excisionase family DNA binding protein